MKTGDFFAGVRAWGEAITFIRKHRLYRYFLIPGITGFFFFLALFLISLKAIPFLMEWLTHFLPDFLTTGIFLTAGKILLGVLTFIISIVTAKYMVLIVLSPVMSYLSEATEEAMHGRKVPFPGIIAILSDLIRGLRINIRNFIYELFTTILLSIIPVINVVSPVTVFLVQSYFAGFSLMDYTLERKRMNVGQTVAFMRQHRELATGLGTLFTLIMLIPAVGWIVAPVLGTVAATIEVEKKANFFND